MTQGEAVNAAIEITKELAGCDVGHAPCGEDCRHKAMCAEVRQRVHMILSTYYVSSARCPYLDQLATWNRRTPAPESGEDRGKPAASGVESRPCTEPMTSIVQWVRYDGTPETLPEIHKPVLLYRKDGRFGIDSPYDDAPYFDYIITHLTPLHKTQLAWDGMTMDAVEIGDHWSYPTLPEADA